MRAAIPGLFVCAFLACSGGGGGGGGPTETPPANEPPTAQFLFAPTRPHEGEPVTFDATGSRDPDGQIRSFTWSFGDGSTDSGIRVSHTYASTGPRSVSLTVTDDDDATATASGMVEVQPPNMAPHVAFTFQPDAPERGQPVIFDGSGSSDPDGSVQRYRWEFGDGQLPSTGTSPTAIHIYGEQGAFTARLTVTDDDQAAAERTQVVTVGPPSRLSFAPIEGEWIGTATEPSTGIAFAIRASIRSSALRGESIGTVVYGNDVCRGDWLAAEQDGANYVAREVIVAGSGCPNGIVTLVHDPQGNTLDYIFVPDAGPLTAQGTLRPVE